MSEEIVDNYEELIDSLESCDISNDCRECDDFTECIHYLRHILIILLRFVRDTISDRKGIFPKEIKDVIYKKKRKQNYYT